MQDRLNYFLHAPHVSDSTQRDKLPFQFQIILNSVSLKNKDCPCINATLTEPWMSGTFCTARNGCWPSAAQSLSVSSSARLVTVFYSHDYGTRANLGLSEDSVNCPQSWETQHISYWPVRYLGLSEDSVNCPQSWETQHVSYWPVRYQQPRFICHWTRTLLQNYWLETNFNWAKLSGFPLDKMQLTGPESHTFLLPKNCNFLPSLTYKLKIVKIQIETFSVMAPCGLMGGYQQFSKTKTKLRGPIPTERPPLVHWVSANFCRQKVSRGQSNGSLQPYSQLSRPEPLLFLPSSSSIIFTRLSGHRARSTKSYPLTCRGGL
jgi:hypothetical protein